MFEVRKEMKKNNTILSSTLARIVAFFILSISFCLGMAGIFGTLLLFEADVYTKGTTSLVHEGMTPYVWSDVYYVEQLYQQGDTEGIEMYLSRRNASMEILDCEVSEGEKAMLLWSNYDGTETVHSYNCFTTAHITEERVIEEDGYVPDEKMNGSEILESEEEFVSYEYGDEYHDLTDITGEVIEVEIVDGTEIVTVAKQLLFRVYIDDTFPFEDEYRNVYGWGMILEDFIYVIPVVSAICVILFLCSFIYLMYSAGHHRGKEGISGGVLYFLHFDVVTVIFGVGAVLIFLLFCGLLNYGDVIGLALALAVCVLEVIWCTIYCMELATELKMGTIFRHTLIGAIFRRIGKGMKTFGGGMIALMKGLPLVMNAVLVYLAFSILQFMALAFFCILWNMDADVLVLCFLEKVLLFPILIYFALVCKKLQEGSKALAEGNLQYKLDTSKLLLGFKEHGENLNRIGEGISLAVEERMRSEHLKTELITNVSHDIKTPLTSIINYADLIGVAVSEKEKAIDKPQLAEYSEVLVRQSKRLKKLLEDLVEASKATTGNLEVNLVPCEINVLLSQAIGEYEQRLSEKQLELIVRQPEETMSILADSRHIWRVFDNLINNIYKYAQENTRVYLTVERKSEMVEIVFRNMSKYPLEMAAEDLRERFVRGDKSRHMEGNGLGLSIAGSLVDLQNGKMEIVTDGDLFKVILQFSVLS